MNVMNPVAGIGYPALRFAEPHSSLLHDTVLESILQQMYEAGWQGLDTLPFAVQNKTTPNDTRQHLTVLALNMIL
jgi:hypothetical protein